MESMQNRFPHHERRMRFRGCFGAFSCFGSQKGGKRIVPASRVPDGNTSSSQQNPQSTASSTSALAPSLLAPPSSPASFSHSAVPSTIQSPSCFSSGSPRNPTSTMFTTGPYAHETQLVSPPVFSTFTTEPSTAPFTPPPELAHLTTPSSPDVPFAKFLTSSAKLKNSDKNNIASSNDLHSTYSLYPGSPTTLRLSGASTPSSKRDWNANFFCPATFARFYLDHNPTLGGRISVSKDSDVYPPNSLGRFTKSPKQEAEELDAYRASFGFSADEIITTPHYVEITDESFSMNPISPVRKDLTCKVNSSDVSDDDDLFAKSTSMRKYQMGLSKSDAEVDYRRGRSVGEGRNLQRR